MQPFKSLSIDKHSTPSAIAQPIFEKLKNVTKQKNCSILIRSTNSLTTQDIIHRCVAGKPLICKAKSSNALFLDGKIPTHPYLAKDFPCEAKGSAFFAQAKIAHNHLLEKHFQLHTFKTINAFISLKKISKDGAYIFAKNQQENYFHESLLFKETLIAGEKCLIAQEAISKPSIASSDSVSLSYLLRQVSIQEKILLEKKQKLPYIGKNENIYQIYLRFEEESYNQLFEEKIDKIKSQQYYYAVRILSEYCGWDHQQQGIYFPLVADYDIFSIKPHSLTNSAKYYVPSCEDDNDYRLDSYDSSYSKLKELRQLHQHLGIISPFENEVRIAINQALGIPMVRHGCQINNLTSSALPEMQNILTITPT